MDISLAGVLEALRRGAVSGGEELVASWEADDQLTGAALLRYILTAILGLSKAPGTPTMHHGTEGMERRPGGRASVGRWLVAAAADQQEAETAERDLLPPSAAGSSEPL